MTKMALHPIDPTDDPIMCETCGRSVDNGGSVWYGSVDEQDPIKGLFVGYSYHCVDCINVLARMADALGTLEGPDGKPLRLNDQGDVET